jgi:hypothetical protein
VLIDLNAGSPEALAELNICFIDQLFQIRLALGKRQLAQIVAI